MIKKLLTSNYDKSPMSNISKLNKIITDEINELKETYLNIELSNDINKAKGKVLDDIGANIRQYRGEASDDIYRALIKSKIARNRADGTLNNLLDVLELSLDMDKNDIKLVEGTHPLYASIEILEVPVEVLAEIGMSVTQLGRLINTMVAAGVKLESIIFEGTFGYVDTLVVNHELGYGDIAMNSGGEFGDIYRPQEDSEFPL